jgi:hypothetical protein
MSVEGVLKPLSACHLIINLEGLEKSLGLQSSQFKHHYFNAFRHPCINHIHIMQIANKLRFSVYGAFYSLNSHKQISAPTSVVSCVAVTP